MSGEACVTLQVTLEQINYLRVLISGDVADRTLEFQNMRDPKDPDRFSNIRKDAEAAMQTGMQLLRALPPKTPKPIAETDLLEIPLFLRRNHVR